jgi:hypothetical protein
MMYLKLRRGMEPVRLAPPVISRSRREQACDTICDMHECVISGCMGTDTVGYLMDRMLSFEPRHTGDRR